MLIRRGAVAWVLAGITTVLSVIAVDMPLGHSAAPPAGRELVGSWSIEIVPVGQPPTGKKALYTFTSDGSLLQAGTTGPSPAHGAWNRIREREFAYTWIRFRFDNAGKYVGAAKLRGTLQVDEAAERLTVTTAKVEVFDTAGKVIRSGDFTAQGTRIRVE